MTLTFPSFSLSTLFAQWRQPTRAQPSPRSERPFTDAEDARADRAFAIEMLARNPDAIVSELGLMMLAARWQMHL